MGHFVLDECDQCLESLDMRRAVQSIFRKTPHSKQVMMFSATLNETIRPICKKFMRNPLEIFVTDNSKLTLHGLQQYYVSLIEKEKVKKLFAILDAVEFNQVKNFQQRILVTTDLFARGIDVSKINVVINFDMAEDADCYLHRVGRAGRFGTKGLAISFVSTDDDAEVLND